MQYLFHDKIQKTLFFKCCQQYYDYFQGKCAEYNTIGALVQPHDGVKCSDTHPPCPSRYISTDAYKCNIHVIITIILQTLTFNVKNKIIREGKGSVS